MIVRDILSLDRSGRRVRTFALGEAPAEVGSHPDCEIVVHSIGVPARALLVQASGGTVHVYDLVAEPGLRKRSIMPLGAPLPLGGGYTLTRLKEEVEPRKVSGTERLPWRSCTRLALCLVGGRGSDARVVHVGEEPLSVGGSSNNAVVLSDRAVSRYHCRIEPSRAGLVIRDLDSTNGTWVDGLRVSKHELRPGAVIRVGRTQFRVVSQGLGEGLSPDVVIASAPMLAVMADVDRFARLPWPVLIRGETGVGKEHVARSLHERGPRQRGPFIPLNGGGLARELIESELFGHERGAFTGAVNSHRGAFERAHDGTLFLDEVAELPPDLQTRLLRVLETWHVRRVGGEVARSVDVRLVCATHRDLRTMVRQGRFRADLYFRIHRLVVEVPALRARPDDIAPLARHFLLQMERELGERELTADAIERLTCYAWPGNVRELRNVLELAAVECDGPTIDLDSVERSLRRVADPAETRPSADSLREALARYDGNIAAAARALGMPRSTLRDRLKQTP